MLEKMIKRGGDWGFATPAGYACLSFRDGKIHTVSIDGQSFVESEAAQDELTRLRERVSDLEKDAQKNDALRDSAYQAGLRAGWNYCMESDEDGFQAAMKNDHIEVLRQLREGGK